jgi:hypothetical protein
VFGVTMSGTVHAQWVAAASGASISGIVFDSLAGKPLVDAQVQLVNADSLSAPARNAATDSLGRYIFAGVAPGRYLLGFMHPMLDSIGVEAKPREVVVGADPARVDLAIPSALALRVGICGAAAVADSDALIIGIVRRASDRNAVDSAAVTALWVEFVLERGRMTRSTARRAITTQESGWFAICGAPSGGTISLAAARGNDSTEALELEVPAAGFVRRDLYFGSARIALGDTSAKPADSLSLSRSPRLTGDGRLTGVVVASVGGRPLAGARVGILNGPQTRADDNGAWTLTGLPTGTRTLEVRAIAHYPVSMPVDVIEGAAPIRVALLTLKSVLDTVRVTASRGGSGKLLEFMQRKKSSGSGRFITSEDIASRNPIYTTDLFRSMPGIYLARDQNGDEILVQRSNTFSSPTCRVSVYMNGMSLRNMSANDINGYVRPNEVIGIEVYTAAGAPPQFSEQNGCGSVVIWSR